MPVRIPKCSPWSSQRFVLAALLHREAVTRFGKYKLGVLWMLTEPLIGVIVLGLLLGPVIGRTAPEMPYAFFLLNGFVLMQTLTGPMTSGIGAISSNKGLLVFPKVQPLDLLLARFIFELGLSVISFTVFCIIGLWMGIRLSLGQLHLIAAAFVITWMIGSGLGLILAVGASMVPSMEKVLNFLKRPLIFISCVLHPLASVPTSIQKILLFNPLVHAIEICRHALFPFYQVSGPNLAYPAALAIVVFSLGICLFHNHRHRLTGS